MINIQEECICNNIKYRIVKLDVPSPMGINIQSTKMLISNTNPKREGFDYEKEYGFDLKRGKLYLYKLSHTINGSTRNLGYLDLDNITGEEYNFYMELLDMFEDKIKDGKFSLNAAIVFYEIKDAINKTNFKHK